MRYFYKANRTYFLLLRYAIITQILTENLGKVPISKNPSVVQKLIFDGIYQDGDILVALIARDEAEKEIQSFYEDEANQEYIQKISDFEYAIYEYIKQNSYGFCSGSFMLATYLAISKNTDLIDREFNFDEPMTDKDRKAAISELMKVTLQITLNRIGIKDGRGGKREREGFVWNDQCKIEFYKTVGSLPKIKDKMLWDYAFEKLNEEDFNYNYIEYLRTETAFRDVPEFLFREAVKTWSKYKDSLTKPKPDEKPFVFALLHTLHLLNYPQTKISTMKRYYSNGKKLSKLNDLDNENSK